MGRAKHLLLATACAVVALGWDAGGAGAYDMDDIDPAGSVSMPSAGKVSFGETPQVSCNITLNGSIEPEVQMIRGEDLGSVTSVSIRNCEGGSISAVLDLPWPIEYESVEGTLPNEITGLVGNMEGVALNVSVFGGIVNCLYSGLYRVYIATFPIFLSRWGVLAVIILPEDALRLALARGSMLCPAELVASGEFSISPEQVFEIA